MSIQPASCKYTCITLYSTVADYNSKTHGSEHRGPDSAFTSVALHFSIHGVTSVYTSIHEKSIKPKGV